MSETPKEHVIIPRGIGCDIECRRGDSRASGRGCSKDVVLPDEDVQRTLCFRTRMFKGRCASGRGCSKDVAAPDMSEQRTVSVVTDKSDQRILRFRTKMFKGRCDSGQGCSKDVAIPDEDAQRMLRFRPGKLREQRGFDRRICRHRVCGRRSSKGRCNHRRCPRTDRRSW